MRVFLCLLLFACCNAQTQIDTKYGPVQGFTDYKAGVDVWWGIPYAAPPLENLRWKPPQAPTPWKEVKNATLFPPSCPQMKIYHRYFIGQEDCLVLNVYAPTNRSKTRAKNPNGLPVLVFVHGGSFKTGSGYGMYILPLDTLYDARKFVEANDVIFVAMNYRLGVFGFLALDELKAEDPQGSSGNYGLQDQRFAMQWVNENIANFGGDPSKVLLFGESAGAISVGYHYTSPASFPYFSAALMESNVQGFQPAGGALSWKKASTFGAAYAKYVGCNETGMELLYCMRGRFAWQVLDPLVMLNFPDTKVLPGFFFDWHPVIDGSEIGVQGTPEEQLSKGISANTSVVIGSNAQDGDILLLKFIEQDLTFNFDSKWLRKNLMIMFHKNETLVNETLRLYPHSAYKNQPNLGATLRQATEILGDAWTFCPPIHFLHKWNQIKADREANIRAYQYLFNQTTEQFILKYFGAGHGFELPYVFNKNYGFLNWEKPDLEMVKIIQRYWSNLARFGIPINTMDPTPPIWLPWNQTDRHFPSQYMVLEHGSHLAEQPRRQKCEFWNSLEFSMRQKIAEHKPNLDMYALVHQGKVKNERMEAALKRWALVMGKEL